MPLTVYLAALLLALVLPFEAIQPVLVTPWLALTDEKLVLVLAVGAWLVLGTQALPSMDEWRALWPSLTLVLVALVAALLAPDFGEEAVRFVWRLAVAAFVLLLVVRVARDRCRLAGLLWAIAIGAGISGVLGLGEAAAWPPLGAALSLFKVAPTRVGGELRVSATFQYATIAAMYFEMAAPLAIALAAAATRRWQGLVAVAIAAVCTANVVLSLTRAGILTLGVVLAVLVLAAWLRRGLRPVILPTMVSAAVLIGGVALLAMRNPVFDMRLVSESDADWYGVAYSVPANVRAEAGGLVRVGLDVKNEGRLVWSSHAEHPFALGYRWLTVDSQGVLDVPPGEVGLTHDVAPGETIHLQTQVRVPPLPAGAYRLDWGMVQRDVVQFYERGWANAETLVEVGPAANGVLVTMPVVSPRDDGEAPWVVGRLELWRAAARLIQARPLLGVGPDNFRHLYGAQLGLETWDERVQANNVYLEVLVDLGVVGLAAFLWLIAAPLSVAQRFLALSPAEQRSADRQAGQVEIVMVVGISLAIVAFLVHGLLDSFLAFTPTALLLWMLLGLLLAQKPQVSGR